jgi:hypothetical protein
MTIHIRQRQTAAVPVIVLGVALVASSAFAQINRYPTNPADPGRVNTDTQTRPLSALQQSDADQANYDFLSLDPQGRGHCYIDAHGLNDTREVVVDWSDDCNLTHASLWHGRTLSHGSKWTSLDFVDPNCSDVGTYLTSLNNRGIAFGTYWSTSCNYQPAAGIDVKTLRWYALPDMKDFPYSQGLSMSNNGLAVGVASNTIGFNVIKHWTWDGRKYLFPTFPADWDVTGFWAGPLFINDSGQIAGQYVDSKSGRMRGYFQDDRKIATFDAPGDPSGGTYVNGITDSGELLLIASYDEASPYYPFHSFSWRRGVFTPLPNVPFPDATATFVFGLNDRGDISGRWVDSNNLQHAFVAYRKW